MPCQYRSGLLFIQCFAVLAKQVTDGSIEGGPSPCPKPEGRPSSSQVGKLCITAGSRWCILLGRLQPMWWTVTEKAAPIRTTLPSVWGIGNKTTSDWDGQPDL